MCPRGLPASFANLDELVTLDLAFNMINDTAAHVGRVGAIKSATGLAMQGLHNPVVLHHIYWSNDQSTVVAALHCEAAKSPLNGSTLPTVGRTVQQAVPCTHCTYYFIASRSTMLLLLLIHHDRSYSLLL